jgi:CBS domain-containing protein
MTLTHTEGDTKVNNRHKTDTAGICCPPDISDDDVFEAMKDIEGYLDITPGDFKVLYRLAYKHALDRLVRSVKAVDVMTRDVVWVGKDTSLTDVVELMAARDISGAPVLDEGGRIAGIISEKDVLARMGSKDAKSFMDVVAHCLKTGGCVAVPLRRETAQDIMTSPAITVSRNAAVSDIAALMTLHNINRVPVVDEDGRLVGIVSRADIVQSACAEPSSEGER